MVPVLLTIENIVENIGGTGSKAISQESGKGQQNGFDVQQASRKDERGQDKTVLDPLVGPE
jgi:hypothetical protein